MKNLALADDLIELFIEDPNHRIDENGKIYTLLSLNGATVTNQWREKYVRDQDGYKRIKYKNRTMQVHRIIYRKYVGPLSKNLTINHKDGNPSNNHFSNLELVSQSENNLHSYKNLGKKAVYGNTVINFDMADEIRGKKKLGLTHRELCLQYGLSKGHISEIVNNKIWIR